MKIVAVVKRTCKFNGSTHERVELLKEDIDSMLIAKCSEMFTSNEECEFEVGECSVDIELQ